MTAPPSRPTAAVGDAVELGAPEGRAALPAPATPSRPWRGEPGTCGTVAVIGMGKIGLPLAAQYAEAGWHVFGVDIVEDVVDALNRGQTGFTDEPGLEEKLVAARADGRFTATLSHREAVRQADVVVVIVPLILSDEQDPDYRVLDRASAEIAQGLHPGSLVIYETTLPVGDTRRRFTPALERTSGLTAGDPENGFLVAYSPERVYTGRIFRDLATYPKIVAGLDEVSAERAAAFYRSTLPAEVWLMPTLETAELAKLAEATYRDVNIALANELARYAERVGVDIVDVIRAANSQPYSHIHQPGIGVGGHCIPVYPHFLTSRAPDLELLETARRVNQDQVGLAVKRLQTALGGLDDVPVLVLGLSYRAGVKELTYSRALPLIERLRFHGARVSAYDPLFSPDEVERCGAAHWPWGEASGARAVITQTADALWSELDFEWLADLRVVFDGRNSLRALAIPDGVIYLGVGLAPTTRGLTTSGSTGHGARASSTGTGG